MKNILLGFLLCLVALSFAAPTVYCGFLNGANTTYTLNESINISGATCLTVNNTNIVVNCAGYSITGNNSTTTLGIYTNKLNTTIKNCIISNFQGGIWFDGAKNGTILNTTANTTYATGYGIYFLGGSNYNTIFNSTGTSVSSTGIRIYGSNYNTLFNFTGMSVSGQGLYLSSSNYNTISNSLINGKGADGAIYFANSGCANNIIANSTINGNNGTYAIALKFDVNVNNRFINNTILNATNLVYLDANAGSNFFYLNNFTNTTGYYMQDLNGSNYFNATYNGKNQGNIYFNVMNRTVKLSGSVLSDIPSLYIGTNGSGYPYNNVNSLGKIVGAIDYAPLTDSQLVVINWLTQNPADITSINAMNIPTYITYNYSSVDFNTTSPALSYKINDTTTECLIFTNGTCLTGWQNTSYYSISSPNYTFRLFESNIYPATYNYNQLSMMNTVHSNSTMTLNTEGVAIELLNVSNDKQYSFFEIMLNGTTTTSVDFFYCNSSYNFSTNLTTSSNCAQFNTLIANEAYDHTHTIYSSHRVLSMPINITTGTILGSSIIVTPVSYIIAKPTDLTQNVQFYYITNTSRVGAIRTTSNAGISWTNQTYTIDAHLHQFNDNTSLYYYSCAYTTSTQLQTCSGINQDLMQLGGVNPTAPAIISPITTTYYKNIANISIIYTTSYSPNGYPIVKYNISLLNSDFTFNSTIIGNNSPNLQYSWNASIIPDGNYSIRVEACDNLSQCSSGYSSQFKISTNTPPTTPTNLIPNGNETYSNSVFINWTASTDTEIDPINYFVNYSNDSGTNWYSITNTMETNYTWDTTLMASLSTYRVRVYAYDGYNPSGNVSSASDFTIDTIYPNVSSVSPIDNYSTTSTVVTFTCNATDNINLKNITLYTNISGTWEANETLNISGIYNSSYWNITSIPVGTYGWNCLAYDEVGNGNWGSNNNTLYITSVVPSSSGFLGGYTNKPPIELTLNEMPTTQSQNGISSNLIIIVLTIATITSVGLLVVFKKILSKKHIGSKK